MVVPAADWSGIDPLHGRMALFRAVVTPASVPTIYPLIGNSLGPVSAALVLLTVLLVLLRKRKIAPAIAAASP